MKTLLQYSNPANPKKIEEIKDDPFSPSDDWVMLEIAEDGSLFYLLTIYTNGWQGDTCHFSIDEAKDQAKVSYDVDEIVWKDVLPIKNNRPCKIQILFLAIKPLKSDAFEMKGIFPQRIRKTTFSLTSKASILMMTGLISLL